MAFGQALTAGRWIIAARFPTQAHHLETALVRGQTGSRLVSQRERQLAISVVRCCDSINLDGVPLDLDVHFHAGLQTERSPFVENLRELRGGKTTIEVIGDKRLQNACLLQASNAPAIDEVFGDFAHLRHMKMLGQQRARRHLNSKRGAG